MNTHKAVFGFVLLAMIMCGVLTPAFAQPDTADDDPVEKSRNLPETPEEKNFVRNQLAQNQGVVGLRFEIRPGKPTWPKVTQTIAGSPAEKEGIKAGDWIMSVRRESTYGLDRDSVAFLFSGQVGEAVPVEVKRPPTNDLYTFKCILVDFSQLADSQYVETYKKQRAAKSAEGESVKQ
jgi:C-terminal processing protease CtpA/Prc